MGCGAAITPAPADAEEQPASASSARPAGPSTKSAAPEVPSQKLTAIRDAFRAIDTNGSGYICAGEMKDLLNRIGLDDLSEEDRDALLKAIDKDNDSKIELREFVEWVSEHEGSQDAVDAAISHWSTNKGLSDLHLAAMAGDVEKIISLIDDGGKVQAGDLNNVTPLHFAARVGKPEAARTLLERNADVLARTSDTKRMPLHAAAENGCAETVALLIAHGAEVNAKDGRARTPLHWAACSGREEAAAELLRAKCDVNVMSAAGYTPFAMAEDWSTTSLSALIADHGGVR